MTDGQQLLAEYVNAGSEGAFRELVSRYVDLVYSAAVRLVNNDTHLAEDITQTVFADLARTARAFSPKVMLGGWLHRHTCFVASKVIRAERRRQRREQIAVEMNSTEDHSGAELAALTPILDEAINQLGADDRAAVLLRFFEQRDFRSVGEALGSSEEAARKRVNRALEKLQLLLKRRGVALSVGALGTVLATHAVSAAPVGLAAGVAASALAGATAASSTSLTILKIMTMTKAKIAIIAVVAAAVAVPFVLQHQAQAKLRDQNQQLQQKVEKLDQLAAENQRLSKLLAQPAPAPAAPAVTNDQSREILRLRGEVARLHHELSGDAARKTNGPSALSGLTANPEMRKAIRDQQKAGMGMIYKEFAKRANLSPELANQINDLLADHVMANVDEITSGLRDAKTREEMDKIFTQQEKNLQDTLQSVLGPDGFAQYQDYTRNLASFLTAEQFKPMLSGDDAKKDEEAKQLYQLMQQETQTALNNAGLGADFQVVPILNFRNIASEEEADKSLKLLDGIYDHVSTRASAFLSPDDLQKFQDFRAKALNNNRMALAVNRKMMAPGAQ
jgi:RNA polymerase sigma factor (sigma-70 family)